MATVLNMCPPTSTSMDKVHAIKKINNKKHFSNLLNSLEGVQRVETQRTGLQVALMPHKQKPECFLGRLDIIQTLAKSLSQTKRDS